MSSRGLHVQYGVYVFSSSLHNIIVACLNVSSYVLIEKLVRVFDAFLFRQAITGNCQTSGHPALTFGAVASYE